MPGITSWLRASTVRAAAPAIRGATCAILPAFTATSWTPSMSEAGSITRPPRTITSNVAIASPRRDASRAWRSRGIAPGVLPVDLHPEARLVVEVNEAVAGLGAADEKVVRQRVPRRIAVRFHAEATARQRRDEMRVQLGRGVRRDHDRVLLGQRRHAQPLGEPRGARAVELHVADRAAGNEVAHREARQFALAVRKRN